MLPPLAQEGIDKAPFMELRRILEDDVREQFGDKGTVDVWSESASDLRSFQGFFFFLVNGIQFQ